MGLTQALGMAEGVAEGSIPLRAALHYHLTVNHFPPIGEVLDTALEVVENLSDGGSLDDEVELPEGMTYRGRSHAPAWACVEAWHLDPFITREEA